MNRTIVVRFALARTARLDKNKDGAIAANKMKPRFYARKDRSDESNPKPL